MIACLTLDELKRRERRYGGTVAREMTKVTGVTFVIEKDSHQEEDVVDSRRNCR